MRYQQEILLLVPKFEKNLTIVLLFMLIEEGNKNQADDPKKLITKI